MFSQLHTIARQHPLALFMAACGLTAVSSMLMLAHIHTIITVRDVSVPIVGQLPQLERKLTALQEQMELSELHEATRVGSQQEKVEVYALPEKTDLSRLIATFEVIRDVLEREGVLASMSELFIGESEVRDDGSTARTLSSEFAIHEDGMATLMLLVRLSGLMTVGDVLTEEEIALLIDRIEQENPSGIVALEQFLAADIMKYAENPKAYEEQLKRSFSSTMFMNAFENVLRTSLLRDVKRVLHSDVGEILQSYKLWPMQMMAVEEISLQPGASPRWYRLGLTLLVFSEESE